MLLVSFIKGPGGFPYVFIITCEVPTLIPVDGITLGDHGVFVLRGDQEVFDGASTLEVTSLEGFLSLFLHFVQTPLGILAFSESLPEVFFFLFEQLRIAAHCLGPMGEGVNDTKFSREVMMAIPL